MCNDSDQHSHVCSAQSTLAYVSVKGEHLFISGRKQSSLYLLPVCFLFGQFENIVVNYLITG